MDIYSDFVTKYLYICLDFVVKIPEYIDWFVISFTHLL